MLIFVLSQCLPVAHQIPFCHISIGGGDNLLPGSAAVWGSGIRFPVLAPRCYWTNLDNLLSLPHQALVPSSVTWQSSSVLFPIAFTMNYYKFNGLKQHKFIILQF